MNLEKVTDVYEVIYEMQLRENKFTEWRQQIFQVSIAESYAPY